MTTIDMSRVQRKMLDDAIEEARTLTAGKNRQQAAQAWDRAAQMANYFAKSARTATEREQRWQTAKQFEGLASQLREDESKSQLEIPQSNSAESEFDQTIQKLIHQSNVRFDQIAGLDTTKRDVQAAYAMSLANVPEGVELPRVKNMLFFGPPGCGKTLLAGAASNGLDATFYNVNLSDILSRYYGDSSKIVHALYADARSKPVSVVFLDEIDAIAGNRESMDHGADRKLLVTLLTELDGLDQKGGHCGKIFTIAGTNLPWELDAAILSRFQKKILIPLPDDKSRGEMLRIHILDKGFQSELSVDEFIGLTEGLSGREVEQVAAEAIECMLNATNPAMREVALQGRTALEQYTLNLSPITRQHFEFVRAQIRPSTSSEDAARYDDWGNRGVR